MLVTRTKAVVKEELYTYTVEIDMKVKGELYRAAIKLLPDTLLSCDSAYLDRVVRHMATELKKVMEE